MPYVQLSASVLVFRESFFAGIFALHLLPPHGQCQSKNTTLLAKLPVALKEADGLAWRVE
jgi:hypothetical protein